MTKIVCLGNAAMWILISGYAIAKDAHNATFAALALGIASMVAGVISEDW